MFTVVPADKDWVGEAAFRQEFTKALAKKIEEGAEQAVLGINPKADPGKVQGSVSTKIVGDGVIEVHRRSASADFLAEPPDLKVQGPPRPVSPLKVPELGQDLIEGSINDMVRSHIPEIIEQAKEQMKIHAPGSVGPATLGEFLRTK